MASLTSLSESRRRKSLRLPTYFDDTLCQQRCVTLVALRQASYRGRRLKLLIFTLGIGATLFVLHVPHLPMLQEW